MFSKVNKTVDTVILYFEKVEDFFTKTILSQQVPNFINYISGTTWSERSNYNQLPIIKKSVPRTE